MSAGVVTVTLTLDPIGDRGELAKTVAVALTWTGNLPFGHASDATFHLWTLATEEQFYLLWPAVLAIGFATRRTGLALAFSALACLIACVATVVWLSEEPDLAYALPTILLAWRDWIEVGPALRPLVWLGTVSYAAYLWNYPLTVWLRPYYLGVAAGVTAAAATLVLAAVSWRLVEQPTRSTPKVLVA